MEVGRNNIFKNAPSSLDGILSSIHFTEDQKKIIDENFKQAEQWKSSLDKYLEDQKRTQENQKENSDKEAIEGKKKILKTMMEMTGGFIAKLYTRKSFQNLADCIVRAASIAKNPKVTEAELNEAIRVMTSGLTKLEYAEKSTEEKKRGSIHDMMDAHLRANTGALDKKDIPGIPTGEFSSGVVVEIGGITATVAAPAATATATATTAAAAAPAVDVSV